ncbi:DUF3016 domain-containing protein [Cupriavidus necator]|uniref:DUF3016 domain-containing protein n=1 Tax=Cupriavidus necator TaxID=106590 RepID=UPI003C6C6915
MGEQRVADQTFNMGVKVCSPTDRLRYEKAMMDHWSDDAVTRKIPARQSDHG